MLLQPLCTEAPEQGQVRDVRAMLLGCDLSGTIDGSLSWTCTPRVGPPPAVRLTTHEKRFGIVEIRFTHERIDKEPLRVGTITVPRALWLNVYRRMALWACGEGLIHLTLDERAAQRRVG